MPYYLRFLKSPTIEDDLQDQHSTGKLKRTKKSNLHKQGQAKLRLTFTCQTDLGDAYYDGNVLVTVRVIHSASSRSQLACGKIEWKQGDRVRSDLVALDYHQELDLGQRPWILLEAEIYHGSLHETKLSSAYISYGDVLTTKCIPEIISVMTPLLIRNQILALADTPHLERRVLRRFFLPRQSHIGKTVSYSQEKDQGVEVSVYEEMGESIARHIWDAALGLLVSCMDQSSHVESPETNILQQHQLSHLLMPYFDTSVRNIEDSLEILELGSGCGIVGLGLARLVPDARLVLTDLSEAMEILDENVLRIIELGLAPGTSVATKVLDWNWALEDDQLPVADTNSGSRLSLAQLHPDLVVVSDCTYNPNSFQALIATLLQVVGQGHKYRPREENMKLDVLVSYKSRHESESQFFEDMLNAGFHVLTYNQIRFPDRTRELVGLDIESAEIFAFTWQGKSD